MSESQSTNELLRLSLLGEGGNNDHLLCTQQKVSVGQADTGIVREAKVKATFSFWDRYHMSSVLKLIPSRGSPDVLRSRSRPTSPKESPVCDSFWWLPQ